MRLLFAVQMGKERNLKLEQKILAPEPMRKLAAVLQKKVDVIERCS